MYIELPKVNQASTEKKIHIFPFQISLQTLELMQATIFHATLMDLAAGQRVQQVNAVHEIDETLLSAGIEPKALRDGWEYLSKYGGLLEKIPFQNVLIGMRSQWDWYIRNLGAFISINTTPTNVTHSRKSIWQELEKIGFKDIQTQLNILSEVLCVNFNISPEVQSSVTEMSLVRNLGLHNRWEVDEYYLGKTMTTGWQPAEIRVFSTEELQRWHGALVELISMTWPPVATAFKDAPDYPFLN